MTIQELAQSYLQWFKQITRDDGSIVCALKDGRPEELADLVRKAHGDMFLDDWRYSFIQDCISIVAELDNPNEPDLEPDAYTSDRLKWLSSRTDRYGYVNEYVKLFDVPKKEQFDVIELIGLGQLQEKQEVYYSVLSSLQELADEMDENEDEDEDAIA